MAWPGMGTPRGDPYCWRDTREFSETLILPPQQAWEQTFVGASGYPDQLRLDWSHEEIVVYGHEPYSDSPWLDWLALHPAAAACLGWKPDPDKLFAWLGRDGAWRAHTQCHLAYFDHAAVAVFPLVRTGLESLMAGGASWRVPCWPGFLTG